MSRAAGQPCAGGIVLDSDRRLLVIERAHDPAAGRWSIPGGRCLAGEDAETACVREVAEETGLRVVVTQRAGQVLLDAPGGGTYIVDDFVCTVVSGELSAGDDARQARWVTRAELLALATAPGLIEALRAWDLLPE